MFAYIRPKKCNVQIPIVRKAPAKGFGLVIIKILKCILLYHSGHHIICQKTYNIQ